MAHDYDYDLVIIGAGVGGHGAALHAVECGMKTAIIEGGTIGGTCVNRGCVPSKALLAASGRVREMKDADHLKMLGIEVGDVKFDRQGIADHATNLASTIRGNLTNSMTALGVEILIGSATLTDNHTVRYGNKKCTAQNIIIATGSTPFVPPGIEVAVRRCSRRTTRSSSTGSLRGSPSSAPGTSASSSQTCTPRSART